jgi:hypothetical protein
LVVEGEGGHESVEAHEVQMFENNLRFRLRRVGGAVKNARDKSFLDDTSRFLIPAKQLHVLYNTDETTILD